MTSVTGGHPRGRRIGLFGGTFDPPHVGHLLAAVTARDALDLDVVLVVPNGEPWQKRSRSGAPVTPAPIRLALARAAVAGLDGLEVSDVEVRRPGPSYTVDTVAALHAAEPDAEIVVIVGRDAAAGLASWERLAELAASATFAVVDRGGPPRSSPPGLAVVDVPMPRCDVSSSDVRARVAAGRSVDVLVPPAVRDLIAAHDLYRRPPRSVARGTAL